MDTRNPYSEFINIFIRTSIQLPASQIELATNQAQLKGIRNMSICGGGQKAASVNALSENQHVHKHAVGSTCKSIAYL